MTYVMHGATGAQGAPVVAALVAAGREVSALTRRADAEVPGARVVVADSTSTADLIRAYQGAKGVFVHLPLGSEEGRLAQAHNILAALRETRPARVVFSTSGDSPEPRGSEPHAVAVLARGLADLGVSHAVIAPTLFLDNLLLPNVTAGVRERHVLGYPLRPDFRVSWASHLDMADVAAALLLDRPEITGVVSVGQLPGVTGPELAQAFTTRSGRPVSFEALTPEEFGAAVAPVIGEAAATGVTALYQALGTLPGLEIAPERSAQKLLGITPRSTGQWLADIGF